ncbi:MAG: hypothetical protein IT373_11460 [Polyangiaceae bacterium]|nr:hypothetical protein [Polyangiaceae bacterium]
MSEASVHAVLGIEWHAPVLAPVKHAVFEAEARRHTGGDVPRVVGYIAPCAWLARTFLASLDLRFSYADPATLPLIGLVASHENACRYCYGTRRAMLRIQGLKELEIDRLEHDLELAELSDATRAVLEFVRLLARSSPRPARAEAEALQARGLRPEAVAEVAGECANWCLGNRVATFLAVPPEAELEALPETFVGRLLRPLLARKMRKNRTLVAPPPALEVHALPYAAVLAPLAATHAGRMFRDALAGAFASDILPRRAKALVFAVVARSLGCGLCEGESRRVLGAEGLAPEAIDQALAHLASPACDALEAQLLGYARDTVRFRPAEIQVRTRALADAIGPARTLETVGVAALANAVVRLAMLST